MEKDKLYYEVEELLCEVIGFEQTGGGMGISIGEAIIKLYTLFGQLDRLELEEGDQQ